MTKRSTRMYGKFESDTYIKDGIMYRRCVNCGEAKPIADFHRNGTEQNGKPAWRLECKVCYNIKRRENRTKNSHSSFVGHQKWRGEEVVTYTHQDWKEVMIFFGGECAYCGCTPLKGKRLTKDHLKPFSDGGLTTPDNIVPACASCNSSKGAEDFKDWYMKQPFFSQDRLNKIFKWRTIMRQIGGNK